MLSDVAMIHTFVYNYIYFNESYMFIKWIFKFNITHSWYWPTYLIYSFIARSFVQSMSGNFFECYYRYIYCRCIIAWLTSTCKLYINDNTLVRKLCPNLAFPCFPLTTAVRRHCPIYYLELSGRPMTCQTRWRRETMGVHMIDRWTIQIEMGVANFPL